MVCGINIVKHIHLLWLGRYIKLRTNQPKCGLQDLSMVGHTNLVSVFTNPCLVLYPFHKGHIAQGRDVFGCLGIRACRFGPRGNCVMEEWTLTNTMSFGVMVWRLWPIIVFEATHMLVGGGRQPPAAMPRGVFLLAAKSGGRGMVWRTRTCPRQLPPPSHAPCLPRQGFLIIFTAPAPFTPTWRVRG
jgi:hypothetical protein